MDFKHIYNRYIISTGGGRQVRGEVLALVLLPSKEAIGIIIRRKLLELLLIFGLPLLIRCDRGGVFPRMMCDETLSSTQYVDG